MCTVLGGDVQIVYVFLNVYPHKKYSCTEYIAGLICAKKECCTFGCYFVIALMDDPLGSVRRSQ